VDFAVPGARSGYVVDRLRSRAGYLADLLLMDSLTHVRLLLTRSTSFRLVNVGGGPGFDAVGLQLLADFLGAGVHFQHEVLDIEQGWNDVVQHIGTILAGTSQGARTTLTFRNCDMIHARPLCHMPEAVDMFIFAYVCVENAQALRSSDFDCLRLLFSSAKLHCVFLFLDSTDRLWPDILRVARSVGTYEAVFVHVAHKIRMVLQRVHCQSATRLQLEKELLSVCQKHRSAATGN